MRFDLLTRREKECLRLLLHPMRPKDIARATGLSVHTVNGHLKSARRKLAAGDSLSAAHLLRKHEAPQKIEGANFSVSHHLAFSADEGIAEATVETGVLSRWSIFPFASKGRPWNDLSVRWRIVWPLLLLGLLALGAGALVAGAASLSVLFLSLS